MTTQTLNDESGYITSTTLYDALLRVRQTQVPTPQGGILVSDNFYDSRGWLCKTNTDCWDSTDQRAAAAPIITVADSQVPDQTVTAFDGLAGRSWSPPTTTPQVKSATATAYYGDRVITVPPHGRHPDLDRHRRARPHHRDRPVHHRAHGHHQH